MPTHDEPAQDESQDTQTLKEQQYKALALIQVISFTADPPRVKPFRTTTLSWEVKVPTSLHLGQVTLDIGGQTHGLSGSASFTLASTTSFGLIAKTELVSREICSLTVTMDESDCKVGSIPSLILVGTLENELGKQFQGSSKISLRGGGISVTLGPAVISIAIPLNLEVSDWFDASMDISIQLLVGMGARGTVEVEAFEVNVHVDWTWVQDLAGCTEFGEKIAQAFMTEIVNNQIAPGIAQPLTSRIQQVASSAQINDPQHRQYMLTSLDLTRDGITFTVCPM